MRKATTTKPVMWRKPSFKNLSPNAKLIYLFLLTGPDTNAAGMVSYPMPEIVDSTGLSKADAKKALKELQDSGRVMWDESVSLFLIIRWIKHNPLVSPKLETSARSVISAWGWHEFYGIADSILSGTFNDTLSIPYREGIDTLSDTPQVQGQVQVQVQKEESGVEKSITEVIEYFKSAANKPRVVTKSESNREFVRARLNEGIPVDDLKAIVDLKVREVAEGSFKEMYLRIETLFNATKCQSYLGQLDKIKARPQAAVSRPYEKEWEDSGDMSDEELDASRAVLERLRGELG